MIFFINFSNTKKLLFQIQSSDHGFEIWNHLNHFIFGKFALDKFFPLSSILRTGKHLHNPNNTIFKCLLHLPAFSIDKIQLISKLLHIGLIMTNTLLIISIGLSGFLYITMLVPFNLLFSLFSLVIWAVSSFSHFYHCIFIWLSSFWVTLIELLLWLLCQYSSVDY